MQIGIDSILTYNGYFAHVLKRGGYMQETLLQHVQESVELVQSFFAEEMSHILSQGTDMAKRLKSGAKLLVCGNGGSAADAQHFAAELCGRYVCERRPLAGIALTTDTSALTAIGNDYGFERIFARQTEALGHAGDLLVGISTSGNSENIVQAVSTAHSLGIRTLGLLGRDGGRLGGLMNDSLIVPSDVTARIQEIHIMIIHFWCEILDGQFK
jgi:D-sedoheptulose 7-phosphate isomerase